MQSWLLEGGHSLYSFESEVESPALFASPTCTLDPLELGRLPLNSHQSCFYPFPPMPSVCLLAV